jgi:hypothetical protein
MRLLSPSFPRLTTLPALHISSFFWSFCLLQHRLIFPTIPTEHHASPLRSTGSQKRRCHMPARFYTFFLR